MITKRTVLILGAGASVPYGFPTGRRIVLQITGELEPGRDSGIRKTLRTRSFHDEDITEFREALLNSNQPSVDAFIENRPEFTDIGKNAIPIQLIGDENLHPLTRTDTLQWSEYLWNQLGTRKQEFLISNLSVITFNYDRSLEYFLFRSLQNAFDLSVDEASQDLRSTIPIIHVYGQLGQPEFFDEERAAWGL